MIVDGFVDWAERRDGHPAKVYTQENSGEWITCHSVVGDLPGHSIPARFMSDEREPGDPGRFTAAAAASSMFILYRDGHLVQMYPLWASTWTSGGREANTRSFAIEAEGGQSPNYSDPLTPAAEETFIRLYRELEGHRGWVSYEAPLGTRLLQHKDVAAYFRYAPTSCASDRYANAWARLEAGALPTEKDMTPQEVEDIAKRVFDEHSGNYYRRLTRLYWVDGMGGDFSEPPDPEVVAAIHAFMGSARANLRNTLVQLAADLSLAGDTLSDLLLDNP